MELLFKKVSEKSTPGLQVPFTFKQVYRLAALKTLHVPIHKDVRVACADTNYFTKILKRAHKEEACQTLQYRVCGWHWASETMGPPFCVLGIECVIFLRILDCDGSPTRETGGVRNEESNHTVDLVEVRHCCFLKNVGHSEAAREGKNQKTCFNKCHPEVSATAKIDARGVPGNVQMFLLCQTPPRPQDTSHDSPFPALPVRMWRNSPNSITNRGVSRGSVCCLLGLDRKLVASRAHPLSPFSPRLSAQGMDASHACLTWFVKKKL